MISRKDMARKYGLTGLSTKVSICRVKSKVKGNFNGQMVLNMKENFITIIFTGLVLIHGLTGGNIKVIGRIIKWTDKVSFSGLMEGNMSEIT